ncbi:MAG: hypothetical protein JW715_06570 [Sedimentisphaerales bacterium]|nr:hypothetical protein [Sedimentisphaerales bacterium]
MKTKDKSINSLCAYVPLELCAYVPVCLWSFVPMCLCACVLCGKKMKNEPNPNGRIQNTEYRPVPSSVEGRQKKMENEANPSTKFTLSEVERAQDRFFKNPGHRDKTRGRKKNFFALAGKAKYDNEHKILKAVKKT